MSEGDYALALVTQSTLAELSDGATLSGVRDLTVSADGRSEAGAEARMGARGGDVALAPASPSRCPP